MSDKTAIEWTDATWNPVTGCTKVSAGCKHCYAERTWARLSANPKASRYFGRAFTDVACHPGALPLPLRWTKPRMIFVNAMSDLFHPDVPDNFIDRVFAVMILSKRHTFQVLTKRPERMRGYLRRGLADLFGRINDAAREITGNDSLAVLPTQAHGMVPATWPLPNVWLGVSVEDQETADARIPLLLDTPAAVRWLSIEPMLGPITLSETDRADGMLCETWPAVDWIVCGGESGLKARPMHPDWTRAIRDQCLTACIPFFFKQWGEWCPATEDYGVTGSLMPDDGKKYTWIGWDGQTKNPSSHGLATPVMAIARQGRKRAGRLLDGREWNEYPGQWLKNQHSNI